MKLKHIEKEIFKSIIGYEKYQISNLGRVKSLCFNKEKILKNNVSKSNVNPFVILSEDKNKRKTVEVKYLVVEYFFNNKSYDQIIHLNNDYNDNRASNLKLISYSDIDIDNYKNSSNMGLKNKFIDNIFFYKETIISKGKGKATKDLIKYFNLLIEHLFTVFYSIKYYDREEYMQDALILLIKNFKNFDELKFDSPFNYFTEIVKRSFANSYNIYRQPKVLLLEEFINL